LPNILKNKFFFRQYLAGTTRAQCTPELTSFKVVEFGKPWYGSIQLLGRIETYQDVPALHWVRVTLTYSLIYLIKVKNENKKLR